MKLSEHQIKTIRFVESTLITALDVDLYNTYHTSKLLNKKSVIQALKDDKKRSFHWSLYLEFILPMYTYLEYTNNYLTVSKMAEHKDIDEDQLYVVIKKGITVLDALNSNNSKIH